METVTDWASSLRHYPVSFDLSQELTEKFCNERVGGISMPIPKVDHSFTNLQS